MFPAYCFRLRTYIALGLVNKGFMDDITILVSSKIAADILLQMTIFTWVRMKAKNRKVEPYC